jgi:hypothetical protein
MTNKLAGKIALVTGGSTGIGLATAKEFVAEGAYVFITGRREKELTEAVTTIGSNVTGVVADASKLNDLDILFERISKEKGRLDIVFANASGGSFLPLGSITEEHYVSTFDTNVKGLLFLPGSLCECLGDPALTEIRRFRLPRSRRQTIPPHSRSSNRLKQETARPSQFPQDDPSFPADHGFENLPRLLVESLGIRCVDPSRAQHVHPDIPALQFVEPRARE